MNKKIYLFLILLSFVFPFLVSAHQPKIPEGSFINVENPEISKAYYGKLSGGPHIYNIVSEKSFPLYVNILIPDIKNQKKDVSAVIIKSGDIENNPMAILDGGNSEWKPFFEPFGHDSYLQGPEYKREVPAGKYQILVTSINNDSKYALAIGEIESFGFKDTLNTLSLIPKLKKTFFEKSPIDFILSPFGYGMLIIIFIISFILGFLFKFILKKFARKDNQKRSKNIGKWDRLLRALLGVVFLLIAIMTSWNPILILISGLCFFQAIFSWCVFYAIMGKNTCPV